MDEKLTLAKYLEDTNMNYMTGAFTHLWKSWRYDNVMPGYNKLYYIIDGEFYLKINDQEYIAKKGQLFLLPYNSSQTYYHTSDNLATKYWVHFTMPCKDKDLLELVDLPHFINVDDHDYIVTLFETMLELEQNVCIESKLRQKACLFQLMAYYIEHSYLSGTKETLKDEKLANLIVYIEEHLQEPLTINTLCSIMHFHPNYFIRYFKEATGQSPMEYISTLRVEHAQRMLQSDDLAIQEIAVKLGFKSSYYFSRVFKKKTGFTPSDYRLISSSKPIYPTK